MTLKPTVHNILFGMSSDEIEKKLASIPAAELMIVLQTADSNSEIIELDESYQPRLTQADLKQPYPPYNPNK